MREGEGFRWTEPVFALRVAACADPRTIALRLLELRALAVGELAVAWNARPVERNAITLERSTLRIQLPEGGSGTLVIAVPTLRAPRDSRRLGLAVVSIAAGDRRHL